MLDIAVPTEITDPINARLLAVSEDRIAGFSLDPFKDIARQSELDVDTVHERIRAMLAAGTIRRVRQTLMATNLAPGALVAWQVPARSSPGVRLSFPRGSVLRPRRDPLDRRGDAGLELPAVDDAQGAAGFLDRRSTAAPRRAAIGADVVRLMPAKCLFALGVGHVRRQRHGAGQQERRAGEADSTPNIVELSALEWRVLEPLKREFAVGEIGDDVWAARAREAGMSLDEFERIAQSL